MTPAYDYKKFALLYVDDEDQARKYFQMAFEPDFQIVTAPGVEEAWKLLVSGKPEIGLVITDQRMPQQPGTELLGRVRRARPEIVRILTTAYADLEAAIEAVNSGAVYKYIVKPWDIRELRVTLLRAMEYFLLWRERDMLLQEKLSSLQQLLVTDRMRSLAILAESLSPQLRNTLFALKTYVDLAKEQLAAGPSPLAGRIEQYFRRPRWDPEDENRHTLKVVRSIAEAALEPHYEFTDNVELAELVGSAWANAQSDSSPGRLSLRPEIAPDLPRLACCRSMLERMFCNLFRQILQVEPSAEFQGLDAVWVIAQERTHVWGTEGVVIEIARAGFDWGEASLTSLFEPLWGADRTQLLAAFFLAHHHGGTLRLNHDPRFGAGFKLTLPFSPERITPPPLDGEAVNQLLSGWDSQESRL